MSRGTELDIPFHRPSLGRREAGAARRVIRSGWLTTGAQAAAFESEFAEYLKPRGLSGLRALAVNSATAGLHLALEALGVGSGDKVALPTLTFTAAAGVIRHLGAEPVFIDSEPGTGNINPEHLRKLKDHLKAVMPVHLAGRPCDMRGIRDALAGGQARIVEDAAHAFPSRTSEGFAGTLGDAGVFSFYATKTITTGEGGMVVCAEDKTVERMRLMRLHGIDRAVWNRYGSVAGAQSWEYDVTAPGCKYNMSDLMAAIGRIQLRRADDLHAARRRLALRYIEELSGTAGLHVPEDSADHAWHLFIITLKDRGTRDNLARALHRGGIGSSMHFIPLHRMTYWRELGSLDRADFPVAESLADRNLSLPLWPGMRAKDQHRVVKEIRKALG